MLTIRPVIHLLNDVRIYEMNLSNELNQIDMSVCLSEILLSPFGIMQSAFGQREASRISRFSKRLSETRYA